MPVGLLMPLANYVLQVNVTFITAKKVFFLPSWCISQFADIRLDRTHYLLATRLPRYGLSSSLGAYWSQSLESRLEILKAPCHYEILKSRTDNSSVWQWINHIDRTVRLARRTFVFFKFDRCWTIDKSKIIAQLHIQCMEEFSAWDFLLAYWVVLKLLKVL